MATPTLDGRAEVGKFYLVPCIKVDQCNVTSFIHRSGWVPVLGPKHVDAEHLEFAYEHWHIDWRFVGNSEWRAANDRKSGFAIASVVTNDTGADVWHPKLTRSPELRRVKCKRDMPEFPQVRKVSTAGLRSGERWQRMERAQAITCNKLKPGNICPHRGIDLTPFIKDDGTVVCPGHGLRWDTTTGNLLPYQGSAW